MTQFPIERRGLTMLEMLVTLVLFGTLAGVLIGAVQVNRQAAGRAQSKNNLKELGLAIHNCHDAFRKFPPAVGWFPISSRGNLRWMKPAVHATIFYHLSPFLEEEGVFKKTFGSSWMSRGTVIKSFTAPLDPTLPPKNLHHGNRGAVSYGVNAFAFMGNNVFLGQEHRYDALGYSGRPHPTKAEAQTSLPRIAAADGTSNTIAFAERFAACWTPMVNRKGTGWRKFERAWGESSQGYNNFSPAIYRPIVSPRTRLLPAELMPQFGATKKDCEPGTWQAFEKSGIQVAMFDGSARTVSPKITLPTWSAAVQSADGMVLGRDWTARAAAKPKLPKKASLTGTVQFAGRPLTGGTLVLDFGENNRARIGLDEKGHFYAANLPLGKAKVSVHTVWMKKKLPDPFAKPRLTKEMQTELKKIQQLLPHDATQYKFMALPKKYTTAATSGISVTLKSGRNHVLLSLKK